MATCPFYQYRTRPVCPCSPLIYNEIADVAMDGNGDFLGIVDFVRRDYGMTREQFLKRFRRAERVFEDAMQAAEARAQMRAFCSRTT